MEEGGSWRSNDRGQFIYWWVEPIHWKGGGGWARVGWRKVARLPEMTAASREERVFFFFFNLSGYWGIVFVAESGWLTEGENEREEERGEWKDSLPEWNLRWALFGFVPKHNQIINIAALSQHIMEIWTWGFNIFVVCRNIHFQGVFLRLSWPPLKLSTIIFLVCFSLI